MRDREVESYTRPEHRSKQAVLHPMLEAAFEALNLAGVNWCLARIPSSLSAPTGDVDLLVERTDHALARGVLRTLGFGTVRVWRRPEPEAFYFLPHPQTGRNLCLHVATELSFGSGHAIRTGAAAGCLRRRRKRGALFEAAPKDAFWILLLHCLLDKGEVALRYQNDLQKLATSARMDDELAREAEALCPAGWGAPRMVDHVHSGNWDLLNRLARYLKLAETEKRPLDRVVQVVPMVGGVLFSRSVRRYVWARGWTRVTRFVQRVITFPASVFYPHEHQVGARALDNREVRRVIPRRVRKLVSRPLSAGRGLTVALLGPDGAGKSTLAANLTSSLPEFAGVRVLYMGLGYAGLPRLARLPFPGSLASVGLLTLWFRYLVARYQRRLGRLVIFDRYTYDAWLSPGRRLTRPQLLARWVWAHACPEPDLVFLLDVPGEKVHERRGESEVALLEAARQEFLSLLTRVPRLQVVDASRSQELVRDDVAERIRRHVQQRDRT